jgi:hypothetical protein
MSVSSSDQLGHIAARRARAGADPRNGYPAATPEISPTDSERRPRAISDLPQEPDDDRKWDERVGREVRHQEVIEATFDRAEAYARLGDFEHAVEWLDRAATVSGGLPRAYRAQRQRWVRTTAIQPRRAGGNRKTRLGRTGAGAGP